MVNHEHVVKFLGFKELISHTHCWVFTEYASGGTLDGMVESLGALQETVVVSLTRQVVDGLVYLHDLDMIHGDIRGANLVVSLDGCVKITDLGWTKDLQYTVRVGSPIYWLSPEMVLEDEFDYRTDVWSLGVVIIELMSGGHPWTKERDGRRKAWLDSIREIVGLKMPIPHNASPALRQMLDRIFTSKETRLTSVKLLEQNWMNRSCPLL
ncbi:kinase-like domain-containing protein [Mycena capillaripes]|nr:kinase-like domain-containing protein [Mycena capillaripes]